MKNKGFTLVELAIVIVIIGLLVGGVMQGQALIEAARVNRAISDVKKFSAAIEIFKAKFNALPGDMPNAYQMFDGSGGSSICGGNNNNTNTGCNGNGDRIIAGAGNSYQQAENMRLWVHLSLAKILPDVSYYPGKDYTLVLDQQQPSLPSSTIADGAFFTLAAPQYYPTEFTPLEFYGQRGVWFLLSVATRATATSTASTLYEKFGRVATPTTTQSLDIKADDGFPTTGSIIASERWIYAWPTIRCASIDTPANSMDIIAPSNTITYAVSETRPACAIMFKSGLD